MGAVAALGVVLIVANVGPGRLLVEQIGIGRPQRVLPVVVPTVPSQDYSILNIDSAGDPVTYDPCKPIHYVINPDGAPADYLAFIRPAIQRAQEASGLEFIYDGPSAETWAEHQSVRRPAPVLISFSSTLDSSAAQADTVGLGGSEYTTENGAVQPHSHYLTGQVELLSSWFRKESSQQRTDEEESVVMHELGHVLGLGHVQDPTQIMFPETTGATHYGVGDLSGLAALGAGQCAL